MALALAYVNEVLNQIPSTVVVDEQAWPTLIKLLKFEGRNLEELVLGRMRLRMAPGGYDGLLATVVELMRENGALQKQVEALTAPLQSSGNASTATEVHA